MGSLQTIKNIFKIDNSVYIFILLALLTASIYELFIIYFLIIIHELGHCLFAKINNIEIEKVYIYPLGGISKFNMELNTKKNIELIILIAGPIFQFLAYYASNKFIR